MKPIINFLLFFLSSSFLSASPPLPYSGKISIDGVNYSGDAEFAFSIYDGNGSVHWRNGNNSNKTIKVFVQNGRYTVLLGGQGMNSLPAKLFLLDELFLNVRFDNGDENGLRQLGPDQRITSTAFALGAEWAKIALIAEGVKEGAINRNMLAQEVLEDINRTITKSMLGSDVLLDLNQSIKTITRSMLPASVRADLNRTITKSMLGSDVLLDLNQSIKTITRSMLPASVRADLNRTITKSMLGSDVLLDLNQSIKTITRSMLPASVRADLNRTITKSMLGSDVLLDLNQSIKTITRSMLPASVRADLNRTITKSMLGSDVLLDLNQSIKTITRSMLPASVRADLNRTITKSMLGSDVLLDLNQSIKTITRSMLPASVRADLNRTITKSMLGSDVLLDLNQSIKTITRSMLPASVRADLNRTITKSMLGSDVLLDLNQSIKTITRSMLPASVRADLNRTITKSMLGSDVLTDLNRTITKSMLGSDVLADLNRTVTKSMLGSDVLTDLNRTITKSMLGSDVLADLNRTVTKSMLSNEVLTDLNRTVTKSMLSSDVLADLNRTVTPQMIQSSSITTAQLNEQILKYLKPEITVSPQAPGLIFSGQSMNLTSQAQGKYLTYQWLRNGQPIAGATGPSFSISDVNGSLHDGNYSVVVSNDFGSVTSAITSLQVDGTPSAHTVASIGMEMIFCPPGTFTMGSPTSETGRGGDETQHQVTLTNGFYLGKYEVTQAQYQTVMNGNSEGLNADPSSFKGSNRPVEKASWEDAQVFLSRLNSIEQSAGRLPNGWKYVLPTEAEWEYACRAGTSTTYSWGNDINSSRANYNWDGGSNDGNDSKQTVEIGQFSANPWGFFDMHGNVWEWVHDWKANYLTGAQTDPEGPASGSYRVARGGSWYRVGTYLRSARRDSGSPSYRGHDIGFRVGFQAVQPDTADPELELFGGASVTREAGQAWAEPGAAGHDARDGNLTTSITITGTVDMNTTGTYILTYSVADAAGNEANATRTVTVVDTTHPVLTLLGDANMSQAKDSAWVDPGATASDSLDGNLTSSITITGTVDVNTTGVYTLTYSISDGASNEANATRVVNVRKGQTVDLNASVKLEMFWVEPGTFIMGSPTAEAGRDTDETEHNVTLTQGFYLGKYEVTQAQYEAVMTGNSNGLSATPSESPNNPNRPVEKVSWADAQVFLARLNAQQSANIPAGWEYVLPTESQWEYACRAGTKTMYSWGNDINSTRANYNGSGLSQTRDVGYYAANPWGFFDMHGNVWEWTADWYQATYPTSNPVVDPSGPASGSLRVRRGGSFYINGESLRSASRHVINPDTRNFHIGFRVGFQFTGKHNADLNASVQLQMLWVEPGTFTMGSPTSEAGRSTNETEHNVTLTKGFYLGKYEVTQAQYEAVMTGNTNSLSATPSQWPNNPNRPVEKVSWADAQIFLTRLNAQQSANIPAGWAYVLPTESQWEYACRAGTSTTYSWGNDINATRANYNVSGLSQTRDVGYYAANPWGFFDMHGNVWEWTADWYQAAYPTGNPVVDPTGPASGSNRVGRGGSWDNVGTSLRSARRVYGTPSGRYSHIGLRVGFQQQ